MLELRYATPNEGPRRNVGTCAARRQEQRARYAEDQESVEPSAEGTRRLKGSFYVHGSCFQSLCEIRECGEQAIEILAAVLLRNGNQ